MTKLSFALALGIAITAATSSSSFAVSCTQQGGTCKSWAAGQGAEASKYAGKCSTEIKSCISRCKAGNKVFIGVSTAAGGGQNYPIDECK